MERSAAIVEAAMKEAVANGVEPNVRAIKKLADETIRTSDTLGKTRAQLLEQKAAQLGVTSALSGYVEKLKEIESASRGMGKVDAALSRTGVSAAQTAAAMRMVPAQMTDIVTQLAGGQSPLLILTQQGGQLKDMFGGVGAAARGFGTYLASLVTPVTVGAAALAGLAYAFYQASEDAKAFNATLVLTNNYAGLTATSVANMAQRVAVASDSSFGKAAEVLQTLATTGQYTSSEMEGLANVIVRTAAISGKSLEDVSKTYEGLAEDPVKWATSHNDSMHFMDTATYQHIQALQEAGNKHEAVQAVIEAATKQVEDSSSKHLSAAAQAWRTLGNEVSTFWAKLKQGASTGPSLQDQIDTLTNEKNGLGTGSVTAGYRKQLDDRISLLQEQQRTEAKAAEAQARTTAINEAGVQAAIRVDKLRDQVATNAEKRTKELAKLAKDREAILAGGGTFSDADYARMQADIADKYKDPKAPKARSNESGINTQLATLQAQNKAIEQEEKRSLTSLKSQWQAGAIDQETYLQHVHDIQAKALEAEAANAQQRADIAGGKKEKAAQARALEEVKSLNAQRVALDQSLTESLATLAAKRAADVAKYGQEQAADFRKKQAAQQHDYGTMFLSPLDKANADAAFNLQQQQEQKLAALRAEYSGPQADQKEYGEKLDQLRIYHEAELAQFQSSLQQQAEVRNSYTAQMKLAMGQISGTAQTSAELAGSAFTSAWGNMSSALDEFVTTGKLNFSSLASSILADLAKIALHAAEVQIFKSVSASMGFFSEGGEVGHYADGGAISGAGTGTSDSIPAMLSNGEYVVKASQAGKYRSLLEAINNGHMSHFATGGAVGSVPASTSGGSVTNLQMNLQAGGSNGLSQEDLIALAPLFQNLIDKRLAQRMNGQGGYGYKLKHGQM
jgi:lambda family phage tail tape measure protein